MIAVLSLLLLAAAVFYGGLIAAFAVGFRRVRRTPLPPEPASWPFVSVIVAARNEERTIGACLRSLLSNDYPPDRYEVIVVDDFSDDLTAAVVRRLQRQRRQATGDDAEEAMPALHLLRMHEHPRESAGHKQHALRRGIVNARGDLILTTDADCTVERRWIRTMARCFTPTTGFVAGPVRYRVGRSLFGKLQALEFLALVATGAGGIGLGRPNMCNGANVGYRRSVYQPFSAPEEPSSGHIASDEILAQRLALETDWKVRFCADRAALVQTAPELRWRRFWAQRRRWAGTGMRYPRPALVAAILGVYVFYVLLLAALVALPFVRGLWPAVAAALLLKIGTETTLVYPACVRFGQRPLFRYFLPEQPLQILYVVLIGAAAALGRVHWKERTLQYT